MKILFLALLALCTLGSCKKDQNESNCASKMKDLLNDKLTCTESGVIASNLYSGNYENKLLYFDMIVCISCNALPPQYGYTCEGEKVTITDFNKSVSNIKAVYNSCTRKYL